MAQKTGAAAMYPIGTRLQITTRKRGNTTGLQDFNKPNGDVGKIGLVIEHYDNRGVILQQENFTGSNPERAYLGVFSAGEVTLAPPVSSTSYNPTSTNPIAAHFQKDQYIECVDNECNTIELTVGEVYKVCTPTTERDGLITVKDVSGNVLGGYFEKRFKATTKPFGEVIAYELIKELPLVLVGAHFVQRDKAYGDLDFFYSTKGALDEYYYKEEQLKALPEWFKPVYKPKYERLILSTGKELEVRKDKKHIVLVDGASADVITFATFKKLYKVFEAKTAPRVGATAEFSFIFLEAKVKLGCVEITLEEVGKLNDLVNQ